MHTDLVVSTFPNAKALPLWAAIGHGHFANEGLSVKLHETGSSREQRFLLGQGKIHIAQAAVDNALAMIAEGHDTVIFMGGEGGMNRFIVQADIESLDQIAGGTLLVDSPDTAYALLARKILGQRGLQPDTDYRIVSVGNGSKRLLRLLDDPTASAAILNPPFSAQAEKYSLRCLGSLDDLFGPYQAGGAFAMRAWCTGNRETVQRYIRAYVASLDWLRDPANAETAIAMLRNRLNLPADIAAGTLLELCNPATGFAPQARLNHEGMTNMIQLRLETEPVDANTYGIERIVDETFYQQAIVTIPIETI